ncbi:MAG: lysophospholipid acyltransferase family protein [Pirellulales bacterium]
MPHRTLVQRLWYDLWRLVCRTGALTTLQVRCHGSRRLPKTGGALVLVNHQSHLDPMVMGAVCDRRMNYLARESLFRFPLFRWLFRSLDAIPIDREGSGLSGLKETLRRLKRGEVVVLFPEGTRSVDGEIGHLKPGFGALARRAGVPLLPAAIDGTFEAWPRNRLLPQPATVVVEFGEPISPREIAEKDDRELVALVETRLRAAHRRAQQRRQGDYYRPPHCHLPQSLIDSRD